MSTPRSGNAIDERVTKLEAALPTLATKAHMEAVRGDIKGWMLATVLTIVASLFGAIATFSIVLRPQQAPIVLATPTTAAPGPGIVR